MTHSHRNDRTSRPRCTWTSRPGRMLGVVVLLASACGIVDVLPGQRSVAAAGTSGPAAPETLTGPVADMLVAVKGGPACSGTPIRATLLVVTAAHCVLDRTGRVGVRSVERAGHSARVAAVLVDLRYVTDRTNVLDTAVLVLDRRLPGSGATLGGAPAESGAMTLAGLQPLDRDGSLLRGSTPTDRPRLADSAGGLVVIPRAPAGCRVDHRRITVESGRLRVPCGLIPGASGGGLYLATAHGVELHGVVSTVSADLSSNGVAPVTSITRLLADPDRFTVEILGPTSRRSTSYRA